MKHGLNRHLGCVNDLLVGKLSTFPLEEKDKETEEDGRQQLNQGKLQIAPEYPEVLLQKET